MPDSYCNQIIETMKENDQVSIDSAYVDKSKLTLLLGLSLGTLRWRHMYRF
jgi:hypothetical protein